MSRKINSHPNSDKESVRSKRQRWLYPRWTPSERGAQDFLVNGFRFSPYGAAEVFYDGNKHSWNQEWYTAGVEWPYKQIFMINTYYLREHCDDCKPTNWNAAAVTLNFFFGKRS